MQETKVIAKRVGSERFTWHKDCNAFIAEASDLPKGFDFFSQVWNDACDAGFILVSERTGRELLFTFAYEDRHHVHEDAEIAGWNFVADPAFNKGLITEPVRALIIND